MVFHCGNFHETLKCSVELRANLPYLVHRSLSRNVAIAVAVAVRSVSY